MHILTENLHRVQRDLPLKNRVWGFESVTGSCTRATWSQVVEPHQETYDTSAKIVSGISFWPSRDPIGTRGGLNIYGFVGNQPISRLDKLGLSWWNCCNECSPLGKKQLKGMKTYLAPGTKGDISPSVGEVGQDLLGSLETLGLIQSAGDLASAQKLAELLLSLADTAIDDGRSGSFQEAALSGIEAIRQNLLKLEGAVVWVRLDWDTCKERRCIIFIKYNDWVADHKWKRCQRGGTHVSGGFDLSVPGELGAGVSGCIRDAVGEFVNGSF